MFLYFWTHFEQLFLFHIYPPYVVITSKLDTYRNGIDAVVCECGAHIKKIARTMVEEGIEGYAGLWDLPGTVGAAVFGNAGCYGNEMGDIVQSVDVLLRNGEIKTFVSADLGFGRRTSNMRKGIIQGIILRVTLKKIKGSPELIQEKAQRAHRLRQQTQPGPQNNLGSCFMSGTRRFWYKVLQFSVRKYLRLTHQDSSKQLATELNLLGHKNLLPYLFDMNRFIWKDADSIKVFEDYVSLYKKLFKGANLEINQYR